jgi:hypothetical protein
MKNTKHQKPNNTTSNRGWTAGVRMTAGVRVKSARLYRPEPGGPDERKWAERRGEHARVVGGSLVALEAKLAEL